MFCFAILYYLSRAIAPTNTIPNVTCSVFQRVLLQTQSEEEEGGDVGRVHTAGLNSPPLTLKKTHALTAKLNPKLNAIYKSTLVSDPVI